jgi:hypothetical protein
VTWSQNIAYFDDPGAFLGSFLQDTKVTAASRWITVDGPAGSSAAG